jgi:hypothetical protein
VTRRRRREAVRPVSPAPSGPETDRPIVAAVGIALFAYYLLVLGGHQYSIDGIVMFQSAKRLLFDHSLVLDPPVTWGRSAHTVSRFPPGLTLAYLPVLALWSPLFYWMPSLRAIPFDPGVSYNPALYRNLPYLLCSGLNPLLTALTACVLFRLCRGIGLSREWSVLAALAYGVASPASPYARFDFAQPLAGLALTAAVLWLLRAGPSFAIRPLLWAGGSLGVLMLARTELVVVALGSAAWLVVRGRGLGVRVLAARVAALLGPVVVGGLAYLWINAMKFGSITSTGYRSSLFTLSPARILREIAGLLGSPETGLLFFFPLAVVSVFGLWRLRTEPGGMAALIAGLIGLSLIPYASIEPLGTTWTWGPRYLVPLVPLMVLAAAFWVSRPEGGTPRRAVFLTLGALGAVASLTGILMDVVPFTGWVEQTLRPPGTPGLRIAASPLVAGWRFVGLTQPDLFWLGLARAGNGSSVAAASIVAVLLGTTGWAGSRLWRVLHDQSAAAGGAKLRQPRGGRGRGV